jgi:hypothetical protein
MYVESLTPDFSWRRMVSIVKTGEGEIRTVVLIGVERALPLISPAYDRGETEGQVKDRWRRYWRKLWEEVEE